jgi:hypothetical protein
MNVYADWRQRSFLEVNVDWRQRTLHQQPAAIPQQLEPTRSMAKGSNIYSREIVDIRLPGAIEPKPRVISLPLRNNRTLSADFAPSAIAVEL